MNIPAQAPLHLLHLSPVGTLATHLHEPEGFPYPTMLPFAPDARHRPAILVSRLAEHTRNLQTDSRAGFLVVHEPGENVLAGERVTLIGRFAAVPATPALVRRYLRYHPEAERYLALGDFSFRVMEVERLRYIGGFGAMGWLDGGELDPLDPLPDEDEMALIANFERHARRPPRLDLAGVDRYGADLKVEGVRQRFAFSAPQATVAELERSLADCIASYAD
ncbi:MAG TPA: pyridoxamine 5'-phosphate oxidase family protein [Trinickia sp.]|nr:pyridoxamine 5'-phosphate oxidase family protein [Trinickia sp.]